MIGIEADLTSFQLLKQFAVHDLKGIVGNLVDFGAFVDIGVSHDGFFHVSELAASSVKDQWAVFQCILEVESGALHEAESRLS